MKKFLTLCALTSLSALHAEWTDKITINGYVSIEYEQQTAGDKHERADEHGSFDSDMFDLVINVHATDRLRIAADLTWEHGSQTEIDKGNVGYEYAFAEYTFSDALKVRAGKMFTPFGIYNEIHTAKPSMILLKEPNPTNKMYFISNDKYEQTMLYPRWGSGVAVLGNYQLGQIPFDYIVQVSNGDLVYGADGNEYDHDDNDQKAITARLRVDITPDLQVGFSYYHDTMTRYEKVYTSKTVTDQNGAAQTYVSKEYQAGDEMTVDTQGAQLIWYVTDDLRLEAEVVTGTLDVHGVSDFRRTGYSILPSYFILPRVNLYCLYAWADPNESKSADSVINFAPGVNIEVDENMYVKSDLFHVISEDNNPLYRGIDYTEFRIGLAIGF